MVKLRGKAADEARDARERARDARDLLILEMIDRGETQEGAARAAGVCRRQVAALLADVRNSCW